MTQLARAILIGGLTTAAAILLEHYILKKHTVSQHTGIIIGLAAIRPEAAVAAWAIGAIGDATACAAEWLDARVAAERELERQRGAAAQPWPTP